MDRLVFIYLLLLGAAFCSCKSRAERQNNAGTNQNLFAAANNDTALFNVFSNNGIPALTIDSAFKKSTLVVVCTTLSIDSSIHGQKAGFYLVGIRVDSVLKGKAHKGGSIYFLDTRFTGFTIGDTGWVAFLCERKTGKLLSNRDINWQWTDNATFLYHLPPADRHIVDATKTRRPKKNRKRVSMPIFVRQPIEHVK